MSTIQQLFASERCEFKYIATNGKRIVTCSERYNCCDCGGEDCGCAYCFSCRACEHCLDAERE